MARTPLSQIDDCRNCGACCTGMGGTPVAAYLGHAPQLEDAARLKHLPPDLMATMQVMLAEWEAVGFLPDDAPCVWYDADKKTCRHHQHRPQVCRDFEIGSSGCRRHRRAAGIDPVMIYSVNRGRVMVKTGRIKKG